MKTSIASPHPGASRKRVQSGEKSADLLHFQNDFRRISSMMVQLAGGGTGGGTWVGDEMQRNDPALEADWLASQANELFTDPPTSP